MYRVTWQTEYTGYHQCDCQSRREATKLAAIIIERHPHEDEKLTLTFEKQ